MQYTAHYAAFTSDNYQAWAALKLNSLETYNYHLAFELSQIAGFKTGYISVFKADKLVLIAPVFVTDYALDTTVQGVLKFFTTGIRHLFPRLLSLRILCVGSAVTDSAQIFFADAPSETILQCLNDKLAEVASLENASVIAFKDIIEADFKQLKTPLQNLGYSAVDNMPVAFNTINFNCLDDYLSTLSYSTRKSLRRKMKNLAQLRIEEHDGMPPNLDEITKLYLNCYEKSELKFEQLNREFFENLAKLLPNNFRFVLYYAKDKNSEKLIGFNCLLHGNGVLMDKYIGLDYDISQQVNLYSLSWLHNIQMCIRDGFHTFQSGQAAYETKLSLGATLTQTYILFKHRNPLINPILKLASRVLAYGNFDPALKSK
jgi:predicted N-acyltransferase